MFLRQVVPRLPAAKPLPGTTFACQVHAAGLGESTAAELLGPILDRRRDPQVGITASGGLVTARVRCLGGGAAAGALGETACEIERRWTPFAYGRGRETLARSVGSTLGAQGRTLATAESCTGGLLSSMIVDVAGCSGWFRGGWVTYSNALKTSCLGVPAALLEARGAVSREVSLEMARAALDRSGADISVAVTGIAGPEGGTPQKPLGTVWIGLMGPGGRGVARRFLFPGERPAVRRLAALWALQLLRLELLGVGAGTTLLWEQADEEGPR
jgi:PncC family amidohydrolase